MMTFIMIIHAIVCVLLACIILMQAGRGGGLTEQFASAESIFGAQTNSLLVRTTTVIATIFIVTSLTLTIMHSMKGKSLMSDRVAMPPPVSSNTSAEAQQNSDKLPQDIEKKAGEAVQKAKSDIQQATQDVQKNANTVEQNVNVAAPEIQEAVTPSARPVPAPAQ